MKMGPTAPSPPSATPGTHALVLLWQLGGEQSKASFISASD